MQLRIVDTRSASRNIGGDRTEFLSKLRTALDRLPPLARILREVLATLSVPTEDVSLTKLASLVERDVILSGRVLAVANSAAFSRGRAVLSVREAAVRLGVNKLRNLALALSVNQLWTGINVRPEFSMLRFNQHALATATLAEILASRFHVGDSDAAFAAGLFQDIGQLLLLSLFPNEYTTVLEWFRRGGVELEERERELFGLSHAEISAEAVVHWNLSHSIESAVRFHEAPDRSTENQPAGQTLSEVIFLAKRFATELGYWPFFAVDHDESIEQQLVSMGIDILALETELGRALPTLSSSRSSL